MPTRCIRGFYCRSYCLLNMFRASLCPSLGAQEYYTVIAACGILCCGFFQVAGLVWSWGLCVRLAGCWFTIFSTRRKFKIKNVFFYLLQLGFHPVAVVGRLVRCKNRRNNTQNNKETIQKHRIHRIENKNTKQKGIKIILKTKIE